LVACYALVWLVLQFYLPDQLGDGEIFMFQRSSHFRCYIHQRYQEIVHLQIFCSLVQIQFLKGPLRHGVKRGSTTMTLSRGIISRSSIYTDKGLGNGRSPQYRGYSLDVIVFLNESKGCTDYYPTVVRSECVADPTQPLSTQPIYHPPCLPCLASRYLA